MIVRRVAPFAFSIGAQLCIQVDHGRQVRLRHLHLRDRVGDDDTQIAWSRFRRKERLLTGMEVVRRRIRGVRTAAHEACEKYEAETSNQHERSP